MQKNLQRGKNICFKTSTAYGRYPCRNACRIRKIDSMRRNVCMVLNYKKEFLDNNKMFKTTKNKPMPCTVAFRFLPRSTVCRGRLVERFELRPSPPSSAMYQLRSATKSSKFCDYIDNQRLHGDIYVSKI